MIKKKIKTVWNGKIGLHVKYYQRAKEKKEDILLVKGNEQMLIPYQEIDKKVVGKSQYFKNKFNNDFYYLVYFDWKPEIIQQTLL